MPPAAPFRDTLFDVAACAVAATTPRGRSAPSCADAPVASRPEPAGPATRAEDPAPADASLDAAESAATAATAAEVGATERRTRAVGSVSVPWDWNIRRASVRRTALASGRCAGEGSGWSVDDPTGDPANSDMVGPAPAETSAAAAPRSGGAPPSDGPPRIRDVRRSTGRTPGTGTAGRAPSSALRAELGGCSCRVRRKVPSSASVAASERGRRTAGADGPVVTGRGRTRRESVDATCAWSDPAVAGRTSGAGRVRCGGRAGCGRSRVQGRAPHVHGGARGCRRRAGRSGARASSARADWRSRVRRPWARRTTGPIPTPVAIPGGVIVVGRGEAPGVGAAPEATVDASVTPSPVRGDRAPDGRPSRRRRPPPRDVRAPRHPRLPTARTRHARRESAVAVARARRRSSRPDGAGRAAGSGRERRSGGSPVTCHGGRRSSGPPVVPRSCGWSGARWRGCA